MCLVTPSTSYLTVSVGPAGSFTPDEQRGMMDSLRSATRHTMFDQWLDATLRPMPDSAAATVQEQLQVCQSLVSVQPDHPEVLRSTATMLRSMAASALHIQPYHCYA